MNEGLQEPRPAIQESISKILLLSLARRHVRDIFRSAHKAELERPKLRELVECTANFDDRVIQWAYSGADDVYNFGNEVFTDDPFADR